MWDDIIAPKSFMMFYVLYNQHVTVCDITLNLNPKSKMKNERENKIKQKRKC